MKEILTLSDAVELFGGTKAALAEALGMTRQAITTWPDKLTQTQSDRVVGAAIRLGKLPTGFKAA